MSYIQRNLRQKATIFVKGSPNGFGGYSYTNFTVNCRWEDIQKIFVDTSGQQKVSRAVIYVDKDVAVGSFIYFGLSTATTPPDGAFTVMSFQKSPNLHATDFERKIII